MSLKVRLLLYSSAVLLIIFALFTAHSYNQDVRSMERAEHEKRKIHLEAIRSNIEDRFNIARTGALMVAEKEEVREAFARRDRYNLQQTLAPLYESLRGEVAQLHFHLPDNTSFLRLHRPEEYGDDLKETRPLVAAANRSQEMVSGIESGKGGLGCRVVVPVTGGEEHLGTVEVGAKIGEDFLTGLKQTYGSEYYLYKADNHDTFIAATSSEDEFALSGDDLLTVMEGKTTYSFAGDREHIISTLPLTDISGNTKAYLKVVTDRSEVITAMFEKQTYMGLLYIGAVIVSAALVMLTLQVSILSPLDEIKAYLRRVAGLDFSTRLPARRKDELGEMAENLNYTVEVIKDSMEELEGAHKQTLTVLDNISAIVYVSDVETYEILFINEYGKKIYGDVIGEKCWRALQKNQHGPCEFCAAGEISTTDLPAGHTVSWEYESTFNQRHYEYRCAVIKWVDGRKAKLFIGTDSTERKLAEDMVRQGYEWYRTIAEDIPALVCRYTPEFKITFVNDAYCRFVGMESNKIVGESLFNFILPEYHREARESIGSLSPQKPLSTYVNTKVAYDGSTRWVKWSNRAIFDENGRLEEYISVGEDITEQRKFEAQLKYLSLHDALTGIYNKHYYDSEIRRLEGGRDYPVAIIVADLDNLKMINDTYGHVTGDYVLQQCAEILRNSIRFGDVLARVGGDEFAIVMQRTDRTAGEGVICRINAGLEKYNLKNPDMPVSISLGISVAESPEKTLDQAFEEADLVMYKQKAEKESDHGGDEEQDTLFP